MKKLAYIIAVIFISSVSFSQETVTLRKDTTEIVQFPDVESRFPGGMVAMREFVSDNVEYPSKALEEEISGKTYVEFIVLDNGNITDIKVVRSSHPLLDAETIRVVESMPQWIPAEYNGEFVASRMRFPITFCLSK